MRVLEDWDGITAMASSGVTTVEDILDGEICLWPGTFTLDVDSISQR